MKTLLLLPILLTMATAVSARTVTVAGSDFLPESIILALEEFAESRGDRLVHTFEGSLLAFRDFNRGRADLIIVAIPPYEDTEYQFPVIPFGFQIGTLVVNGQNPLSEIDQQQIGGIFGAPGENPITRWAELGLPDTWDRRLIEPAYADPPMNPVAAMFSAYFLENEPIREAIPDLETAVRLEAFVSGNDNAIGLLGGLPLGPDLKPLNISTTADGVGFGPSIENVNFGDYPLTLPYFVCVPRSQYRLLVPYLEFLLSDEIAALLEQEGFFPVLRSRRLQLESALPAE